MRYLVGFKKFEALEVDATDEPEEKVAKEEINDLQKQLKDFNAIRQEIDSAFMNIKDNANLNAKVEEISKKYADNPIIDEYVRVASLQKKARDAEKEMSDYTTDKYSAEEELKGLSKSKADPSSIQAKQAMINDIKKKQDLKKTNLEVLKKQAADAEKAMKDQMKKMENDSKRNMANL